MAGVTYLVTRRCSERRFFLRPSKITNDIFRFVLALAADRYGVRVHAFCVLSNHFHLVVTDLHARLPEFQRYLDSLVGRATNRAIGHWESFWDRASYSAVRLEDEEAILEKIVYVLANPVAAGLVRRAREWPGLWSEPSWIGGPPIAAERPTGFFREGGPAPAAMPLQLHRPPGFEADEAFADVLRERLSEAEERAAAALQGEGRVFHGAARVLAQRPTASPLTEEPRRALSPSVACRSKWRRIEALERLADFQHDYREALDAWRAGVRSALFPQGTWHMRVQHAALCASG